MGSGVGSRRLRVAVAVAVVSALGLLGVSAANPIAGASVNGQLEMACSDAAWSGAYDRTAWTPLLWSCDYVCKADPDRVPRRYRPQDDANACGQFRE